MRIKNRKPDFHFQLVGQTLGKVLYRLEADQGAAVWGCWRKAVGGDRNRQCDPRQPAATCTKEEGIWGKSPFKLMNSILFLLRPVSSRNTSSLTSTRLPSSVAEDTYSRSVDSLRGHFSCTSSGSDPSGCQVRTPHHLGMWCTLFMVTVCWSTVQSGCGEKGGLCSFQSSALGSEA